MRSHSAILVLVALAPLAGAQTQQSPQTARQALIEMFFGAGTAHFEKHLPDATRNTLKKLNSPNGMSVLDEFSAFAAMAKTGGAKFETFDTGPNLLVAEDPRQGQRVEISVEGDDLSGEEDRIEVALHVTQNAKEQTLPFVPRFTFVMKTESEVWRLSEIVVTLKVPLADPNFLKALEDRQRGQNEQAALWGMRSVINAENSAHSMRGTYACSLSELARVSSMSADGKSATVNMLGSDLAGGKSGGYVFAITACDGNKYKLAAEPAVPESGQRAFCSDESGTIRAAADGKATTCLQKGDPIKDSTGNVVLVAPQAQ